MTAVANQAEERDLLCHVMVVKQKQKNEQKEQRQIMQGQKNDGMPSCPCVGCICLCAIETRYHSRREVRGQNAEQVWDPLCTRLVVLLLLLGA